MGLLLKRIDGDSDDAPVRLTADYELVVRESTRRQTDTHPPRLGKTLQNHPPCMRKTLQQTFSAVGKTLQ